MSWITIIAGSKLGRIVAVVLVAGLTLYGTIQYIQSAEHAKVKVDIIQKEIKTEEKIKDAIKNSPTDARTLLEWLRDRP
jgi:apolipoprotein N-acyltransferase